MPTYTLHAAAAKPGAPAAGASYVMPAAAGAIALAGKASVLTYSGAAGLPAMFNPTTYDPAGVLWSDAWTTYADTADVQNNVSASFGSGSSAAHALAKINNDLIFPNAAIIVTQVYNDDDSSASGASPELRRSFPACPNVWVVTPFRFVGTAHPDFAATADWTSVGNYPPSWANSYKMLFTTWSGASNRQDIVWPNATTLLRGLGISTVTGKTSQRLTTMYGQPVGTNAFPAPLSVPADMTNGKEWWAMIQHYVKLSSTHCVARFWLGKISSGSGATYISSPTWYFDGEDWSGVTGTLPDANGIAIGANRNKTAPTDGIATELFANWSTSNRGPFKGLHIIRGPSLALDGRVIAEPSGSGIGSHGGGPY